jgi:methylmalonyl-CoA/ethylmalonyl-CoA epimerase
MDESLQHASRGIRTLHHIGFVVANIPSAIDGFIRSLGASWDQRIFEDPHQKVKVAFLVTGAAEPQIEIVEPVGENSPVRRFLAQKGGGLHHFCYQTDDLEAELQLMRSRRAILVRRPTPAVAFGGRRIAWMLTQEKLLVEFLESNPAAAIGIPSRGAAVVTGQMLPPTGGQQ